VSATSTGTSRSTITHASPTPRSSPTKALTAACFLSRAIRFRRHYGTVVERVLTDNGPVCIATIHAVTYRGCASTTAAHPALQAADKREGRTLQLIRTLLAGWAYGAIYRSHHERTTAPEGRLCHDNHRWTTRSAPR
jgi:hypothetical protein